jgi:hydrogenase expression/formation protein HypC
MCLGVPGKIVKIDKETQMAEVDFEGSTRTAGLHMVPEAKLGDYVIIHAGFAIRTLDEKEAKETLKLLEEFLEIPE